MDKNVVREKLNYLLAKPEDDARYQAYMNAYTMLLDEVKVTSDTANLAIDGVDIDQGVNFLDIFVSLDAKEIQEAWKVTRGSESYKKNDNYNALKLMCSFAASALGGDENTSKLLGNILNAFVHTLKTSKQKSIQPIVYSIVRDNFVGQLPLNVKYPSWEKVKITPESGLAFCSIVEETIGISSGICEDDSTIYKLKKWLADGKAYLEVAKELKEREKNKPPKKSTELLALVEHYKKLEDELDKTISENVNCIIENKRLREHLVKIENEKKNLEKTVETLQKDIHELTIKVDNANKEVDERKKLNVAQVQYREDVQVSLLQDIARALKAEYGDFAETVNYPMNEMLGEIYREKLKQVFKILEQKGIKVEK